MQTNVDDNQNDLEVALYMSPSDGSAVSDSPVCNLCDVSYSRETGFDHHVTTHHTYSKCSGDLYWVLSWIVLWQTLHTTHRETQREGQQG